MLPYNTPDAVRFWNSKWCDTLWNLFVWPSMTVWPHTQRPFYARRYAVNGAESRKQIYVGSKAYYIKPSYCDTSISDRCTDFIQSYAVFITVTYIFDTCHIQVRVKCYLYYSWVGHKSFASFLMFPKTIRGVMDMEVKINHFFKRQMIES